MTNGMVLTSTNGHFWTPVAISNTNLIFGVAFVGGIFVAVGDGGTLLTSAHGILGQIGNSGVNEKLNAVGYGNGTFIAVGNNGVVTSSSDGISWTAGYLLIDSYGGITFGKWFASLRGWFGLVGSTNNCGEGALISSSDGVSWTNHMIPLEHIPLRLRLGMDYLWRPVWIFRDGVCLRRWIHLHWRFPHRFALYQRRRLVHGDKRTELAA